MHSSLPVVTIMTPERRPRMFRVSQNGTGLALEAIDAAAFAANVADLLATFRKRVSDRVLGTTEATTCADLQTRLAAVEATGRRHDDEAGAALTKLFAVQQSVRPDSPEALADIAS